MYVNSKTPRFWEELSSKASATRWIGDWSVR